MSAKHKEKESEYASKYKHTRTKKRQHNKRSELEKRPSPPEQENKDLIDMLDERYPPHPKNKKMSCNPNNRYTVMTEKQQERKCFNPLLVIVSCNISQMIDRIHFRKLTKVSKTLIGN